jgi:hypothetical protein
LLYADDKVLIAQSRKELERKLQKWIYALESRQIKVEINWHK